MRAVVTGASGFIGSHLVEHLSRRGWEVLAIDVAGPRSVSRKGAAKGNVVFVRANLSRTGSWANRLRTADLVFHFAADPDVRTSSLNPNSHFYNNVVATWNVLEAMRTRRRASLVFASSSTVLGEPRKFPTPEDYESLLPISVYGATKLACEGLIKGHSAAFSIKSLIVRPANVVGPHLTHGVILDFLRRLIRDPKELTILGSGRQRKSYVYVTDFLSALDVAVHHFLANGRTSDVYNISNDDTTSVVEIARIVSRVVGANPRLRFVEKHSDGRAWVGDVKKVLLETSRLKAINWRPKLTSGEAVRQAAEDVYYELRNRPGPKRKIDG